MSSGTQLRVLTAAVLIPVVVAAIWWGPTWLVAGLAGIIAVLALLEFFAMAERIGFHAYRLWTCLAALGIFTQQWHAARLSSNSRLVDLLDRARSPQVSLELVLFGFVLGAAGIALGSRRPLAEVFSSVSVSAAGLVVIVIPFSAVVRLNGVYMLGPQLLLFTVVLVWVGDTAAYFVGRAFGRMKMSPQVSPNKTWEGAGANLLGALLVGALFGYWMKIEPVHMLAMAILGSIAGQVGDVFKSTFKRSAGVKDSGTILPGHGGILDRIDALILAAPAVWYYFEWFVMRRF
ncbi:MAG: phosphatidate cytidylyltransferase [Acidobacteriia bacterium]|nr:phosphatidate cytidylyltransferase [Terriglobia bacterium]